MGPAMASSRLAGLIGFGIQGSLTPAMHEHEGAAQGMRYVYRRSTCSSSAWTWRRCPSC